MEIIDDKPRLSLEIGSGPEAQAAIGDALASLRDELDAVILEQIGVLIGALSRTQTSRLEVTEGPELRLWVMPELIRVEVDDHPFAALAAGPMSNFADGPRPGMVEHLSDRWGVIKEDDGSFVTWFELSRPRDRDRATAAAL